MSCDSRRFIIVDDLDKNVFKKFLINAGQPTSAYVISVEADAINLSESDPIFTTWAQTYSAEYEAANDVINAIYARLVDGIVNAQELQYNPGTGELSITHGNSVNISANAPPLSLLPQNYIYFKSTKSSAITINAGLSAGEYVTYAIGYSTPVTVLGNTPFNIASSNNAPKDIYMWRSNSSGAPNNLTFNSFVCSSNNVVSIDVSRVSGLQNLNLKDNLIEDIYLRSTPLTSLDLGNNRLADIDLAGSPLLIDLKINNNALSFVSFTYNSLLKTLDCSVNSLGQLYLANKTNLDQVLCHDNELYHIDLSGVQLSGAPVSLMGLNCSGNNLSAPALNFLYTNLGTARLTNTKIDITGNTGAGGDTPSIATGKNYDVVG
jgi:uncharacterized protein YjbI with pentapeptide repeats